MLVHSKIRLEVIFVYEILFQPTGVLDGAEDMSVVCQKHHICYLLPLRVRILHQTVVTNYVTLDRWSIGIVFPLDPFRKPLQSGLVAMNNAEDGPDSKLPCNL